MPAVSKGQPHPLREFIATAAGVPNRGLVLGVHHQVSIVLQDESYPGGLGGVGVPEGSVAVDHQVAVTLGGRSVTF